MNTLSKEITSQFFFRPDGYEALRANWSEISQDKERRKSLTPTVQLLYLILCGKDWRKTFSTARVYNVRRAILDLQSGHSFAYQHPVFEGLLLPSVPQMLHLLLRDIWYAQAYRAVPPKDIEDKKIDDLSRLIKEYEANNSRMSAIRKQIIPIAKQNDCIIAQIQLVLRQAVVDYLKLAGSVDGFTAEDWQNGDVNWNFKDISNLQQRDWQLMVNLLERDEKLGSAYSLVIKLSEVLDPNWEVNMNQRVEDYKKRMLSLRQAQLNAATKSVDALKAELNVS